MADARAMLGGPMSCQRAEIFAAGFSRRKGAGSDQCGRPPLEELPELDEDDALEPELPEVDPPPE